GILQHEHVGYVVAVQMGQDHRVELIDPYDFLHIGQNTVAAVDKHVRFPALQQVTRTCAPCSRIRAIVPEHGQFHGLTLLYENRLLSRFFCRDINTGTYPMTALNIPCSEFGSSSATAAVSPKASSSIARRNASARTYPATITAAPTAADRIRLPCSRSPVLRNLAVSSPTSRPSIPFTTNVIGANISAAAATSARADPTAPAISPPAGPSNTAASIITASPRLK